MPGAIFSLIIRVFMLWSIGKTLNRYFRYGNPDFTPYDTYVDLENEGRKGFKDHDFNFAVAMINVRKPHFSGIRFKRPPTDPGVHRQSGHVGITTSEL